MDNGCGWQGMGRGGGLILPNAQKSAAAPTHPLLASDVWTRKRSPKARRGRRPRCSGCWH